MAPSNIREVAFAALIEPLSNIGELNTGIVSSSAIIRDVEIISWHPSASSCTRLWFPRP